MKSRKMKPLEYPAPCERRRNMALYTSGTREGGGSSCLALQWLGGREAIPVSLTTHTDEKVWRRERREKSLILIRVNLEREERSV